MAFKFSIRDLLLVTVIVALAAGWWVDRSRLAKQANETEAYKALSKKLAQILRDGHPLTRLEISVNGDTLETSSSDGHDFEITQQSLLNSSALAPIPPKP